jgi:hypothetical protein
MFGPQIQIVRVAYPPEPWQLARGVIRHFRVEVEPPDAEILHRPADESIAFGGGGGTNVTLEGRSNGVTFVQAELPSGVVCASKEVTTVAVTVGLPEIALCVGQTAEVPFTIVPPDAQVTFVSDNPADATVVQDGNLLRVTCLSTNDTLIHASLGRFTIASTTVRGFLVLFPTNDFFVPVGGRNGITADVVPRERASSIQYSIANTNIAELTSSAASSTLEVRGVSKGTTEILAYHGTNALCSRKSIRVGQNVTLTHSKHTIAARTAWPGAGACFAPQDGEVELSARVADPGADPLTPVELEIDSLLVFTADTPPYSPSDQGTVARKPGATHDWVYTAWEESSAFKRPVKVKVSFRALIDGFVVSTNMLFVNVQPVFNWLAHDKGNYACAYNFVRWKYAAVLNATGGAFNGPPLFSSDPAILCGRDLALGCTQPNDMVTFASGAFVSENIAASVIGHELKHTTAAGRGSECAAYTWECNNRAATGIDSPADTGYLNGKVIPDMNEYCR